MHFYCYPRVECKFMQFTCYKNDRWKGVGMHPLVCYDSVCLRDPRSSSWDKDSHAGGLCGKWIQKTPGHERGGTQKGKAANEMCSQARYHCAWRTLNPPGEFRGLYCLEASELGHFYTNQPQSLLMTAPKGHALSEFLAYLLCGAVEVLAARESPQTTGLKSCYSGNAQERWVGGPAGSAAD